MRVSLALVVLFVSIAHAAEYPPSYQWRTIDTPHFSIHFHQGEEDLARRAAAIAEHVHARITPLMDYAPEERTHIILTDHVDVSNGSATPFPNNRIEVYVSAPGGDPSSELSYYDDWLNTVITHEYTHILHLDQAYGVHRGLRKVFGRNPATFPNLFSPLWMTEGIATMIESEATDAGRLKGTFLDMVLRTAAVEGKFLSEPQAAGLSPEWPSGAARYFYGSKFLAWLARTKGMEKVAQYFHDYAGNFIPFRVNASAEAVFGDDMSALWRQWSREQQQIYKDDVAELSRYEPLTAVKALTKLGYETLYPAIDRGGARVAYGHHGPYEWPTLRVFDLAKGRDVATLRVNSLSHLSWNADATQIAFAQLDYVHSTALLSDVYVWDLARDRVRRVTHGARLKDPAFTPDGKSLIAVENRAGRNRLVEVDIVSGGITPLVTPDDLTQFAEPDVSDETIALTEWRNGRVDVVLYDRDGKRRANLTQSFPASVNAAPRIVGNEVVFSSDVTGVSNIYMSDGHVLRRISNVYGGAFFPNATSDGRIIFSNYSARGFDLAMFENTRDYSMQPRKIPTSIIGAQGSQRDEAVTDQAGEGARPSRPYSAWQSARPRWWFPVIGSEVDSKDNVTLDLGAITTGADVLGFHSYSAEVLARTGEKVRNHVDYSLLYSYDRLLPTISALASGFSSDADLTVTRGAEREQYHERTDRILVDATLPWRHVRWQMYGSAGAVRDRVTSDIDLDISDESLANAGIFTGTLQGVRGSLLFNNAREFGYSISPENGVTAQIDYENLASALGSDASMQQLRGDVRSYIAVPFVRAPIGSHVLALRIAAAQNTGEFILQRELKVGGVSGDSLLTTSSAPFPVRGYDDGTLRGTSAALVSLEYRFPIYQIDRGPSVWPIFFNRVLGDVFFDSGSAWYGRDITLPALHRAKSDAFDETISSAGAELAMDMTLGFALQLRYRVGVAYPFDSDEGVRAYLTLGSSF